MRLELYRFLLAFVLPVLLFAWILFAVARSRVLFRLIVKRGAIVSVKGRIPPAALGELSDVFRGTEAHGTLTGSIEQSRVRLDFSGRIRPEVMQRARNVVGTFSLARFTAQSPR
jgi:hypothetical protein